MENTLFALNAERDMIITANTIVSNQLLKKVDSIIDTWFTFPFEATCKRRWIQEQTYPERGIYINFEIGFFDSETNAIDFGSDIDFYYDSIKNTLEMNYGTCGKFSKKDVYQFKRAKILSYVFDNIEKIETEFHEFCVENCPVFLKNYEAVTEIDSKICQVEQQIKNQKRANIADALQVGSTLLYNKDCSLRIRDRLFNGIYTIKKVTPKFVVLEGEFSECRIRKELIIDHVSRNFLSILKED